MWNGKQNVSVLYILWQTSSQIPELQSKLTGTFVLREATERLVVILMPLEKAAFNSSVWVGKWRNVSVRWREVTRPSASCWPTRSSPRVWRPASPSTDSWRSGTRRRGNTVAGMDVLAFVLRLVEVRTEKDDEYLHFRRQIWACLSAASSLYSPPPTLQRDHRCCTNTKRFQLSIFDGFWKMNNVLAIPNDWRNHERCR